MKKPLPSASGKNKPDRFTASRWQRWLSYLYPLELERTAGPYNPELAVYLSRGRLQLATPNAIYSYDDLYTNFAGAFQQVNLDALPGNQVLVLGVGLGSIPYLLEKTLGKNYAYTLVELDEVVLELAQRYTLRYLTGAQTVFCTDAAIFVAAAVAEFDLICMDVFADALIPAPFQETSFLEHLRERLAPSGLLLYNLLVANKTDQLKAERFLQEKFLPIFPTATHLQIDTNWILINDQRFLPT